jgi:hypothetical protein
MRLVQKIGQASRARTKADANHPRSQNPPVITVKTPERNGHFKLDGIESS